MVCLCGLLVKEKSPATAVQQVLIAKTLSMGMLLKFP